MKRFMKNEEGIVLVVTLLILLVLTLIGISAVSTTTFEASISGNERVGTVAFYASEAGVQEGVNKLPDTSPIPLKPLGNASSYWSGSLRDKSSPKSLKSLAHYQKLGFDTTWEFKRFQVNATGESFGAMKEIEVQVSYGPFAADTIYNN
jgi:hypothetical protein